MWYAGQFNLLSNHVDCCTVDPATTHVGPTGGQVGPTYQHSTNVSPTGRQKVCYPMQCPTCWQYVG